jgi:hypothetical protein
MVSLHDAEVSGDVVFISCAELEDWEGSLLICNGTTMRSGADCEAGAGVSDISCI